MTALRVLADLEYSRYNPNRQGKKHGVLPLLALFALLVLGGMVLPMSAAAPESPFLAAVLLLWFLIMGMSAVHIINFYSQRHREWFLCFPHSRLTLLHAKLVSLLKLSLKLALLITAVAASLYGISVLSGRYEPLPAGELALMLAAYIVFILVLLPLAVMTGLLFSVLMSIRSLALLLLLVLPYTLLWVSPLFAVILLNTATAASSIYELLYISPPSVMLYSAVLLVLDFTACYFLLPLIAKKGLSGPAHPENTPFAASFLHSGGPRIHTAARSASSRSSFLTLYRLDASRLRSFEGLRIIGVLKLAVPVLMAVAAYFLTGDLQAFLSSIGIPFMLPVLFGFLWMLGRSSFEHKQLHWWLLFPHSRLRLLLSAITAVWITVMRINVVLVCSALTGILAGRVLGNTSPQDASLYISWLCFSFMVYSLALTLGLGLLQGIYYMMKSRILSLLIILLAMSVPLMTSLINKFLFPSRFTSAPSPSWSLLGWIALIGLPLAFCCIAAGAKYFHLALGTNKETAATKQA